jgi:hypothetical protein
MFADNFCVEPLDFGESGQDDFEFDFIDARSFIVSSSVHLYVDKSLDFESVITPLERTLIKVGIVRVGVAGLAYRYTPHKRAFDVFSTGAFQYRGEPIVKFEVPTFGSEIMTTGMFSSVAFSTHSGTMVCAQAAVNAVVQGVRREIVGAEVVQFTITTQHYKATFVYDVDDIYSIKCAPPALYIRDEHALWCVHGVKSPQMNAVDVQWLEPSHEAITSLVDAGSIIVNVNCVDYKVTNERLVVLQATTETKCADANGRVFECNQVLTPCKFDLVKDAHYECKVISESTMQVQRVVETVVDTAGQVDRMLKSPLTQGLLDRVPMLGCEPMPVQLALVVPSCRPFNSYRAHVFSTGGVGPLSWASVKPRALLTADAVAESLVLTGVDSIDPVAVNRHANECGLFLIGQTVRALQARVPYRALRVGRIQLTTHPGNSTTGMLVIRRGARSLLDATFAPAVRVLGGVSPYYILYFTPVDDNLLTGWGAVDSEFAPYATPAVSFIVKILEGQVVSANAIAKMVNCSKQAVNMVLYGRPDLFEHMRGDPIVWKLRN